MKWYIIYRIILYVYIKWSWYLYSISNIGLKLSSFTRTHRLKCSMVDSSRLTSGIHLGRVVLQSKADYMYFFFLIAIWISIYDIVFDRSYLFYCHYLLVILMLCSKTYYWIISDISNTRNISSPSQISGNSQDLGSLLNIYYHWFVLREWICQSSIT